VFPVVVVVSVVEPLALLSPASRGTGAVAAVPVVVVVTSPPPFAIPPCNEAEDTPLSPKIEFSISDEHRALFFPTCTARRFRYIQD
jgi:hypothetical protein